MPRRGIRIKINPHNRFDLSHLSPDEANQTLRHILQDLCFWGSLPAPTATATATATTTNNNIVLRTPQYYQSQFSEIPSELLRCQSSGSESRSSRGVSSQDNNSTDSKKTSRTTNNDRPPRNQPQTRWKTAIDTSSGQTYYYDPMTRQTQWEKVRVPSPYIPLLETVTKATQEATVQPYCRRARKKKCFEEQKYISLSLSHFLYLSFSLSLATIPAGRNSCYRKAAEERETQT